MTFGLFMILLGAASLSAQLVHLIDRLDRRYEELLAKKGDYYKLYTAQRTGNLGL